jgi:Flp pilus assembly protein TadG
VGYNVFGQITVSSNRLTVALAKRAFKRAATVKHAPRSFTTFKRDQSGATAVEFGLVALPFLMMMAAMIDVGSYYLALNALDRGVDDATRAVRTGEAQTSGVTSSNGALDKKSVAAFKQSICDKSNNAGGNIDCAKMTLLLSFTNNWAALSNVDQSCTSGAAPNTVLKPSTTASDTLSSRVGGTSAYVIVTVCYPWAMAKFLPFVNIGNLQDGSMLLQSSSAFQTEPY